MKIRTTKPEDYGELLEWWTWFRFPPPAIDMLPNDMHDGIMVYSEGVNICAGFLYATPSKFCWVEFIVSNPEVKNKDIRKEALELLIKELSRWAKETGFKVIFTSVANENLINRYKDCGYTQGSKAIEMIKIL